MYLNSSENGASAEKRFASLGTHNCLTNWSKPTGQNQFQWTDGLCVSSPVGPTHQNLPPSRRQTVGLLSGPGSGSSRSPGRFLSHRTFGSSPPCLVAEPNRAGPADRKREAIRSVWHRGNEKEFDLIWVNRTQLNHSPSIVCASV